MKEAPPVGELPTWKRLLFGFVLACVGIAVLEVSAHAYLRVFRGYDGTSFLQYQFDPYKSIHPVPDWRDTRGVTHNAQGFRRTEEVQRRKPAGTYRVFLMGASTAYGTGGLWPHLQQEFAVLDNSETIDAYLEALISSHLPGSHVEVINAAIPSVWTHHHLIYLNQAILGYKPDLVLFLDGLNDHFHFDGGHDQFASYAYNEQAWTIMGPPTVRSLIRMNGWWVFRRSAFAQVSGRALQELSTVLRGAPQRGAINPVVAVEQLQRVFPENALAMIERSALILKHEGIPAVFMLQPMLALERSRADRMVPVERELFRFNLEANPIGYEEFLHRATPVVASMVGHTVEALDASFLDLTNVFWEAEEQMFTDYAHLTPAANRRVAEEIYRVVRPLLPVERGDADGER